MIRLLFVFFSFLISSSVGWNTQHKAPAITVPLPWTQPCQSFPIPVALHSNHTAINTLIAEFAQNISSIFSSNPGAASLTVNLVYDQDILWTQGYGLKNLSEPSSTPDGNTMYRIGSVTKIFTTMLAMISEENGLFDWDDQVVQYEPLFKPINPYPSRKGISFDNLATHMAGLQRFSPCYAIFGNCSEDNSEMWARISETTLINPIGLSPEYSNLGFSALGHLLEEMYDSEWGVLLSELIFAPLRMNHTGAYIDDKFYSDYAIGHTTNNEEVALIDIGWESPSGSMYSCTNDLANVLNLIFRENSPYHLRPNQILDSKAIREWMHSTYVNIDGTGFGRPWEILDSPFILSKAGGITGYQSYIVFVPQLRFGITMLQSSDDSSAIDQVLAQWMTDVVPAFYQIMQDMQLAPYIPSDFKDFVGTYILTTGPGQNTTVITGFTTYKSVLYTSITIEGLTVILDYIKEGTFMSNLNVLPETCETTELGWLEYVYFFPTSPPSLSIPGIFPGEVAYMQQ